MAEEKKPTTEAPVKKDEKAIEKSAQTAVAKSVYGERKQGGRRPGRGGGRQNREKSDEFEQSIIDLARVTRVMAGGKRMRFRACICIGNRKGKVGIGVAKGADVTMAINKAVNKAKKAVIDVPIVNETIPHEIKQKTGAAVVFMKPATKGRGVIAGGAVRMVLELSGIKNITTKNLGTNNKLNVAKCTVAALDNLKKVEVTVKKADDKKEDKKAEVKPAKKEVKSDK